MNILRWIWSWFGGPSAPAPDFIVKAQAETVRKCQFLPQASTVVTVFGALTGQQAAAATVVGVASTICGAVSKVPVTLTGQIPPTVEIDGVIIEIEGVKVDSDRL